MARKSSFVKSEEPEVIATEPDPVQVPSIGRIVHYKHVVCCAAIIVNVNSERSVGLTMFHPNGDSIYRGHVLYGEEQGQWHWPEKV